MLSTDVVVLDGGLSNALADRGHDLRGALWTARLLRDSPEEIAAVHRAYFAAGARVATTASYQASVAGFTAAGIGAALARELIRRSVIIAREVRDELAGDGVERLVAASVGPYGAVLADGSEYRGRYGISSDRLRDFHGPRLELLADAGPDLIAVETIPDLQEAAVLADLLDDLQIPAWLSFSIDGDRTGAGQPLAEAFAVATDAVAVIAVGVNCCPPADVLPAVRLATAITGKPAVTYPNRGECWDAGARTWSGDAAFEARLALEWVAAGARFVGGCCRVGPADIAALAATLATFPAPRRRSVGSGT